MRAIVAFAASAVLSIGVGTGDAGAGASQPVPHAPILITSDADFASCGCVVAGDGTAAHPFQIGPWKIDDLSQGYAVKVDNTLGAISHAFTLVGITSNPCPARSPPPAPSCG